MAGMTSSMSPATPPDDEGHVLELRGRTHRTSSDTSGDDADGMLSMTNQPRSSRVAPAVDRPAPRHPGDHQVLAHRLHTLARLGAGPRSGCMGLWRRS